MSKVLSVILIVVGVASLAQPTRVAVLHRSWNAFIIRAVSMGRRSGHESELPRGQFDGLFRVAGVVFIIIGVWTLVQ